jgi:23S rRNA (adenine2503-C2)-methyltransferase
VDAAPLIYDLTLDQITDMVLSAGEPDYRATQIWQTLYHQLIDDPASFTNIPKSFRQQLSTSLRFASLSKTAESLSQDSNTHKVLFQTAPGDKIETVLMRYEHRKTVCISSQSGCGIGCVFCATGQMGFERNLSSGEIVEQVLYFARQLGTEGGRLTNIVMMGMGEPFQNYDATMMAIDTLNHPAGFNFGARRITVSTVGLVPMIDRFTEEKRQVNLAVSLHAATDKVRDRLVPINRKYPLEMLLDSCRNYVSHTRRRITFEWAMIEGINDDLAQAKALADRVDRLLCHVNLIPLNPTRGYSASATENDIVTAFQDYLKSRGISCTTRLRRGIEIQAGCGQLAGETS